MWPWSSKTRSKAEAKKESNLHRSPSQGPAGTQTSSRQHYEKPLQSRDPRATVQRLGGPEQIAKIIKGLIDEDRD